MRKRPLITFYSDIMKYDYYPGCTLKTKAKELDRCLRASAEALGIQLEELPEWQCCGGVYTTARDEIATKLSAVRALSAARDSTGTLVTVCAGCHNVLKRVNDDVKNDDYFNQRVNNYLLPEKPYLGETRVVHFLELLRDEVGFDEIKKRVVNPIGKKIAPYYGCLLLRPSSVMAFDDPENPTVLEKFVECIGGTPVVSPMRNECCGAYTTVSDPSAAAEYSGKIVDSCVKNGANLIITACPLCQYNLVKRDGRLPVVYFTELLAEALGVKE